MIGNQAPIRKSSKLPSTGTVDERPEQLQQPTTLHLGRQAHWPLVPGSQLCALSASDISSPQTQDDADRDALTEVVVHTAARCRAAQAFHFPQDAVLHVSRFLSATDLQRFEASSRQVLAVIRASHPAMTYLAAHRVATQAMRDYAPRLDQGLRVRLDFFTTADRIMHNPAHNDVQLLKVLTAWLVITAIPGFIGAAIASSPEEHAGALVYNSMCALTLLCNAMCWVAWCQARSNLRQHVRRGIELGDAQQAMNLARPGLQNALQIRADAAREFRQIELTPVFVASEPITLTARDPDDPDSLDDQPAALDEPGRDPGAYSLT